MILVLSIEYDSNKNNFQYIKCLYSSHNYCKYMYFKYYNIQFNIWLIILYKIVMYTPLLCVSSRSFMVLSNSSGDTFTLFCKFFEILDRFSKSLFNFGPKSLVIFIENMAEASPEP